MGPRGGIDPRFSSSSTTVVLPTPLGPETIMSGPMASVIASRGPMDQGLLHVLHHSPTLFERRLDLEYVPGNAHVDGLRAERVRLAAHFLEHELQFAARLLAPAHHIVETL